MKFPTRQLVTMAVFGALWGLVEISLGSVLHAINIPLTGLALTCTGLAVAMIGRLFVPRRGSTIFIGVIATVPPGSPLWLYGLGWVIAGIGVGLSTPAYQSLISKAVPARLRGVAFGLFSTSLGLVSLPAPAIGGYLWEKSARNFSLC